MTATAHPIATRHVCTARCSWQCTDAPGKPRRKRCSYCGGSLRTITGTYGVFAWRGDGRYYTRDAVRTFASEARAETFARSNPDYVARWLYMDGSDA